LKTEDQIVFAPFRLDARAERLYRGAEPVVLRPKSLAVLRHLLERPEQLVTKDELLDAVWPETAVSDTVLKVCVREIREALGDDQKPWRFIETAHRRGYRFIGKLTNASGPLQSTRADGATVSPSRDAAGSALNVAGQEAIHAGRESDYLAGREAEVARLESFLSKALAGERQVVFVTGEPGIGKTAVVDTLVERAASAGVLVGRGQCLEQYGAGEAYMPVLDALTRLCRQAGGERLVALLRRHAPMWLAQMPGLVGAEERERLQQEIAGATRERMLREMSQALELLTADAPLVLVLEDLHWSDYSTVDLLSSLAARRLPARLMLVGTYRPAEVFAGGHPLKAVKQELQARRRCEELSLTFLDERAVAEYLAHRFQGARLPAELARWTHRRTDGNPLFMVNVIDYLVDRGLVAREGGELRLTDAIDGDGQGGVPENIRQMIERQIDRLGRDEQRTLEAASVAGAEFTVAAVASALGEEVIGVEERCEELARRHQFLRACRFGELPDGALTGRYGFIHALYQNALYERVPPARRARLHRRIGEHVEKLYGERAGEFAAELAMHFEQARDHARAVRYLQLAAENASRRFAHREAVALARRGLELLKQQPDTSERAYQELTLRATLCVPLAATEGYGAAEVEETYSRARSLCQQLGDSLQLFPILVGLSKFYVIRAELETARQLGEQLLRLAEREGDAVLLLEAHWALGVCFVNTGEFTKARQHLERALALYRPEDLGTYLARYGHDPNSVCRCFLAWVLWSLGHRERAEEEARAALAAAEELKHPETLGFALFFAAWLHQLCRDSRKTLEHTTRLLAHADEHGLVQWGAFGKSLHGWALAIEGRREEGIEMMSGALDAYRAIGSEVSRPHFLGLLAEALAEAGRTQEGLTTLAEALAAAEKTGGRYYEAELYRLKGELLLRRSTGRSASDGAGADTSSVLAEAEACFQMAVEVARRQEAKAFELLAVQSLSRLRQSS
jgi:DNA-binding winged helix-turn-helix (wHTH) protein/predicted ATPase